MTKRYSPSGLIHHGLNTAKRTARTEAAKKRRSNFNPDDYSDALVKTKPAPTVNTSQSMRMGDDIVRMVDESEKKEVKKKKKKSTGKIKTRKNIYEKTRWM